MYGGNTINPLDHVTDRANILNNHLAEVGGKAPLQKSVSLGFGGRVAECNISGQYQDGQAFGGTGRRVQSVL